MIMTWYDSKTHNVLYVDMLTIFLHAYTPETIHEMYNMHIHQHTP